MVERGTVLETPESRLARIRQFVHRVICKKPVDDGLLFDMAQMLDAVTMLNLEHDPAQRKGAVAKAMGLSTGWTTPKISADLDDLEAYAEAVGHQALVDAKVDMIVMQYVAAEYERDMLGTSGPPKKNFILQTKEVTGLSWEGARSRLNAALAEYQKRQRAMDAAVAKHRMATIQAAVDKLQKVKSVEESMLVRAELRALGIECDQV